MLEPGSLVRLVDSHITLGVGWDQVGGSQVDLDASAVAFDLRGNVVESIYYGNLFGLDGSIVHSGDARQPGVGDAEQITINFGRIPHHVCAVCLVVNSYTGQTFGRVETATVRILKPIDPSRPVGPHNEVELYTLSVGALGNHTGLLLCKIYRAQDETGRMCWNLHCTADVDNGRVFADMIPLMQASLKQVFPDIMVNRNATVPYLRKGEVVDIDPSLNRVFVGLGWDVTPGAPMDLDASSVCFDINGNHIPQDDVFFAKQTNRNGSIRHSGDNLDGEGDGDDELIQVYLRSLPEDAYFVVFTVNVYTANQTFARVKTAYVRLLDNKGGEVLRYPLVEHHSSNAMLVCALHRVPRGWAVKALGIPSQGTILKDLIPDITNIVQDMARRMDFSGVVVRTEPLPRGAEHIPKKIGMSTGPSGASSSGEGASCTIL